MSFSAPSPYVQLPFTTDPNDLADEAIAYLQGQWSGWTPDDSDMGVVLLEAMAPMAANAAQIAAQMPPAALIAFGTQILGIPYQPGVSASATATFTVQDGNGPYDIPAGSEFDMGGVAFQTQADLTIPNGQTTGQVLVAANDVGVFANGLTGTDWTSITLPVFVTGMTLNANTSGGVDQQDDTAYLNMIATEMQLRSQSVITLVDFEIVAVNTAGIGRAAAVGVNGSPRNINVYVTDTNGNPVSSAIKTALLNTYEGNGSPQIRMVNSVIQVLDPTYTTVGVTYSALCLPGVDSTGLRGSIAARLSQELSAAGWGSPNSGQVIGLTWVDQPVVHLNRIIGVISGVTGVNYVETCSLSGDNIAQLAPGKISSALSTGGAITTIAVNALPNPIANGATITLTDPTGAHTQTWTLGAAAAQGATSITVASQTPNYAYPINSTIEYPLSTAGAITSIGVVPLVNAIASGAIISLTEGSNTQTFTTSAAAAVGATSISVTSATPTFAFDQNAAKIGGPVTGDLTMNDSGAGALPLPGTFTGTIDQPAT